MGTYRGYRVVHNGYQIEFFNTPEEVEDYIMNTVLAPYRHLCPKKTFDRTFKRTSKACEYKNTRIIRYEYTTRYEEDFIIDFN